MEDTPQDTPRDTAEAPVAPAAATAVEAVTTTAPVVAEDPAGAPAVQNDEISEDELQAAGPTPYVDSTVVQQDAEVIVPMDLADFIATAPTLPLPSDTYERTYQTMNVHPDFDFESTPEGQRWQAILEAGLLTMAWGGSFLPTVEREGSSFRQAVPSEKGALGASKLKFGGNGPLATGEKAILEARALLGMGAVIQIPLWHSGFWVSIKAPQDSAVMELSRRLSDEKIQLGRRTHGMAFANNSVFLAGHVVDFVMDHIYDTSLQDLSTMRTLMSSFDITLLAWGMACVMWPKGFQYARALLDEDGKPTTKIEQQKLNVAKLLWTDTSALTEWQVKHMAGRHGSNMTTTAVQRYQSEFTRGKGRDVEIAPGLFFELSVPSVDTYLNSGQRWINNIVQMVDRAFGVDNSNEQRNKVIFEQGKATHLRQYSHWVTAIRIGVDESGECLRRHTDVESIERLLDSFSSEDGFMAKFFAGVRSYMEDSTISLLALPTFAPKGPYAAPLPRFPHLLPLDAIVTFFTLLDQRATQIQQR